MTRVVQKHVLVIEDNELNIRLFNNLLAANGYKVTTTMDAIGAIEAIKSINIDLVICDIQLPEISGINLLRILRDEGMYVGPCIACTAFAMKGDRELILAAGFDEYISKPVSVSKFLEAVERQFHKHSS